MSSVPGFRCKIAPLAVLLALLFTGGCGKSVDVVQPGQFKIMADRMSEELIARDILDSSRRYTAGVWGGGDVEYGKALFTRLSPDFLFEDSVGVLPAATFASGIRHSDRVLMREAGFTIQGLRQNIAVNMIAVTDWNGDGRKDWLVSCLVDTPRGGKSRDYYVVIADPPEQGALRGSVVAIYESFGLAGRLYMRESTLADQNGAGSPSGGAAPTVVEDTVPGLKPVTTPPGSAPSPKEGLEERSL